MTFYNLILSFTPILTTFSQDLMKLLVRCIIEGYTHNGGQDHCFIFTPPEFFFLVQCFTSPSPPSLLFCFICLSLTTPVKLREAADTPSSLTSQTSKSGSLLSAFQHILWRNLSLWICNLLSQSVHFGAIYLSLSDPI